MGKMKSKLELAAERKREGKYGVRSCLRKGRPSMAAVQIMVAVTKHPITMKMPFNAIAKDAPIFQK